MNESTNIQNFNVCDENSIRSFYQKVSLKNMEHLSKYVGKKNYTIIQMGEGPLSQDFEPSVTVIHGDFLLILYSNVINRKRYTHLKGCFKETFIENAIYMSSYMSSSNGVCK